MQPTGRNDPGIMSARKLFQSNWLGGRRRMRPLYHPAARGERFTEALQTGSGEDPRRCGRRFAQAYAAGNVGLLAVFPACHVRGAGARQIPARPSIPLTRLSVRTITVVGRVSPVAVLLPEHELVQKGPCEGGAFDSRLIERVLPIQPLAVRQQDEREVTRGHLQV